VKPLLYVYRVLLTGLPLMRTGVVNANLVELNEDARLPYIADQALLPTHTRYRRLFRTISLPVVSLRQPRRPFRTGWVLLDSRFVPEEGRRCRPRPLLGRVASGFQRRHVAVHKDNILAGSGPTRVKLVVIEKERSRSRRKRQDEVRNSAGKVPLLQ